MKILEGESNCYAGLTKNSYLFLREYRPVNISSCKSNKSYIVLKQLHSFIRLLENNTGTEITVECKDEIIRLQSKVLRD